MRIFRFLPIKFHSQSPLKRTSSKYLISILRSGSYRWLSPSFTSSRSGFRTPRNERGRQVADIGRGCLLDTLSTDNTSLRPSTHRKSDRANTCELFHHEEMSLVVPAVQLRCSFNYRPPNHARSESHDYAPLWKSDCPPRNRTLGERSRHPICNQIGDENYRQLNQKVFEHLHQPTHTFHSTTPANTRMSNTNACLEVFLSAL